MALGNIWLDLIVEWKSGVKIDKDRGVEVGFLRPIWKEGSV